VAVVGAVEKMLLNDADNKQESPPEKQEKSAQSEQSAQPTEYLLQVPVDLIRQANVLDDSEESVISTKSVGRFFVLEGHQSQFANQVKLIQSISEKCGQLGISCYEETVQQTLSMIQSFHDHIIQSKEEYIKNIRVIFKRHKFTILLCQTMCRILQYFISNHDAFMLALKVYTDNKVIPDRLFGNENISDIWKSKGAFKVLKENLDKIKELKTSREFVSFQQAQQAIYAPCSAKSTLKTYVKRASAIMCNIVHGSLAGLSDDPYIQQVARLFNIPDSSTCGKVDTCETCVCIGESGGSNIKYSDIVHQRSEHMIETLADVGS
jgi:hypothetical protein